MRIRLTNGSRKGETRYSELRRRGQVSGTTLSSCYLNELESFPQTSRSQESVRKVNPDKVVLLDLIDVLQRDAYYLSGGH